MSSSEDRELLHTAIAALRDRAARPGGYAGLSEAGVGGLCATLSGIAEDAPELDGVTRDDAIGLARRVLDDEPPRAVRPVAGHGRLTPRERVSSAGR